MSLHMPIIEFIEVEYEDRSFEIGLEQGTQRGVEEGILFGKLNSLSRLHTDGIITQELFCEKMSTLQQSMKELGII